MIERLLWAVAYLCVVFTVPVDGKNNGQWDNAPPSVKEWFHRDTIQKCCSDADGVTTDWEIRNGGYYVPVPWNPKGEEHWERVPDNAIIFNEGNPVGKALIWFNIEGKSIRCFIPGEGV